MNEHSNLNRARTQTARGRWRIIVHVVLLGAIVLLIVMVGLSLRNPRRVPARACITTLLFFQHQSPGPWTHGNSFTLAPGPAWTVKGPVGNFLRQHRPVSLTGGPTGWGVLNMHAENFSEIVRQLKLESVEILLLDDHTCLVIDPRIPREWFCPLPADFSSWSPTRQCAVAAHLDKFSLPATNTTPR